MRFEIYQDERSLWRFRLVGNNNEIVAQSEAYKSKSNARRAVKRIKEAVPNAEVFVK